MVIIKAFLFLFINLGMGFLLVFTLQTLLFFPEKKKYIKGVHIPLTPGLVYHLKGLIVKKLYTLLHDFLNDCENLEVDSRISKIEQNLYTQIWDRLNVLNDNKYIPQFITRNLQNLLAQIIFELTRYFIRTFIPYLIERYNVESYIALLEKKADISILKDYYTRYIHRFLLYVTLSFFLFTGILNMFIYLIVR